DGVPWAIKRTPGCMVAGGHSPLLSRLLMHIPRERLDVLERRRRQNAMAEIENVAVSSARARQHIVGRGEHAIERPEEKRWIEVALDPAIEADALPRFVERDAPVGADHIATGFAQLAENRRRADAEMNRRHIVCGERVEDPPCVREDELAVVARVQRADPRVEDLHRVDAGFNLRDEIVADDAGEEIAEAMPRRRG